MRKRSEPVFETNETEAELRSRSDARRQRIDAEENLLMLAVALTTVGTSVLGKLELPDGVRETVEAARRVRDGAAKNRALRLVRAALRDVDVPALRDALESTHGVTISPAKLRRRDRPR